MKKPLIILTGPTAVGKTKLSIALAKAVNGEIISADSMQVYQYMNIGTAKVMPEEMQGVKHYLIDEFNPKEEFNVVKFKEYAVKYIEEIYAKKKLPIIVGGTGFYIQAVLKDIDFCSEKIDSSYRKQLEEKVKQYGNEQLYEMLKGLDPEAAAIIHPNNVKKVIRALEYFKQTGCKISEHNAIQKEQLSPYQYAYFVLTEERDILYKKIDKRVDLMIEKGLVTEVQWLYEMGYTKDLISMQGLGYKELVDYLDGLYSLEEAVYVLKRDTRHFAKRQLTWFRREQDVIWVMKQKFHSDEEKIVSYLLEQLKQKNIL